MTPTHSEDKCHFIRARKAFLALTGGLILTVATTLVIGIYNKGKDDLTIQNHTTELIKMQSSLKEISVMTHNIQIDLEVIKTKLNIEERVTSVSEDNR